MRRVRREHPRPRIVHATAAVGCLLALTACTHNGGGDGKPAPKKPAASKLGLNADGNSKISKEELDRYNDKMAERRAAVDTSACGIGPHDGGAPPQEPSPPPGRDSPHDADGRGGTLSYRFKDWEPKEVGSTAGEAFEAAAGAERTTYGTAQNHGMPAEGDATSNAHEVTFDNRYQGGTQAWNCRKAYAEKFFADSLTLKGTAYFYDPHMKVTDDNEWSGAATLSYCTDLSGVLATGPGRNPERYGLTEPGKYALHTVDLVEDGEPGVGWRVTHETTDPDGCTKDGRR